MIMLSSLTTCRSLYRSPSAGACNRKNCRSEIHFVGLYDRRTLEVAGVEFFAENGDGPGVRLHMRIAAEYAYANAGRQ